MTRTSWSPIRRARAARLAAAGLLSAWLLAALGCFNAEKARGQVADEEQNLWEEYARLQEVQKHFAMRKVTQASQIYPVFRDLFKAEGVAA